MPLAWDSNEVPFASTPQQEPTPLTWTPMRAQTMTPQTGGFRGFGLKRMREGDGEGLPGTPLLQAGQASEAYRRTRQRSDKVYAVLKYALWLQKGLYGTLDVRCCRSASIHCGYCISR